jgi:hypothetical protein
MTMNFKGFSLLAGLILFCLSGAADAAQGMLKLNVFPAPPNLVATIHFSEPSGNNILDAEETGWLLITVRNNGKGDAFDVTADIRPGGKITGLAFERSVAVGPVPAGGTIEKSIKIMASEDVAAQNVDLTVTVREANGFDAAPMRLYFRTKAFEPPKLVVADLGVKDSNGNGRVEPMEIVELTVRVQNMGHGDARGVSADVQAGPNVFIAGDNKTHFDLGGIPSGKFRDFKFMFYTNTRIADGERIPLDIRLGEARPRFNADQPLALAMNAPQKKMQEIVVKGEDAGEKEPIALAGGLNVDVDLNIPEGRKAGKYDIAVVIGNRNYTVTDVPAVDFAVRGARVMKEYLVRAFGYDPKNILYAEDATLSKFNEFFGTERDHRGMLYKWVRKGESRVFVYYAGHGAPDLDSEEAYIVPVDANPAYIRATGYRLQTFYDNLAKTPAKNITVVLDSCFSGSSEKGMLFKGISPALIKVKKEYRGPANAVLFTSAAADQVSTWYPEKKHSLFTYYFLKGIQGEADFNGDGRITVGEMDQYLKEYVPFMARRLSGREQQPVVMGGQGDVLVSLKKMK